jgi:hypothetical protein
VKPPEPIEPCRVCGRVGYKAYGNAFGFCSSACVARDHARNGRPPDKYVPERRMPLQPKIGDGVAAGLCGHRTLPQDLE